MNNEFTLQNLKWNALQETYAKCGLGTEFFKNWQLMNGKESKFRVTYIMVNILRSENGYMLEYL